MIGLPSLQALDGAAGPRIWLAAEPADMRCGFDRLAERVRSVIGADPLSGHLFLFFSRGCRTAAILSSLASACRRHDIDPQVYFTQLLVNLPALPISQLPAWLPDQWKRQHLEQLRKLENHHASAA
jgi:hypothetical protein